MLCYGESGMSVMEMSHRSPAYEKIIERAEMKDGVRIINLARADLVDIESVNDGLKTGKKCFLE